jgi:hypothetical protein
MLFVVPGPVYGQKWPMKQFDVDLKGDYELENGVDLADHLASDLNEAARYMEKWQFSKSGDLRFPAPAFEACIDGIDRYDCTASVRPNGKIYVQDLTDRNSYDPIPTGGVCSKDLEAPAAYKWDEQAMFIHPDPPHSGTALQIHYATAHELFHAVQRAYEKNNGFSDNLNGWVTSGQWFLEGGPDAMSYEWLLNSPSHPTASSIGSRKSLNGMRYYSYPLHKPLGRTGPPKAQTQADCGSEAFEDRQRGWILQAQRTSSFWRYLAGFRPGWHLIHKLLSHQQSTFNSLGWVDEALKKATDDICTGRTDSDLEVGEGVGNLLANTSLTCDQLKKYGGLFLFYPNFIAQHTQDMLAHDRKEGNQTGINATFKGGCRLGQIAGSMDIEIEPLASRCVKTFLGDKSLSVSASLASNPKRLSDLHLSINGCLMLPTLHMGKGPGGGDLKVWDLTRFATCNPKSLATPINKDTEAHHLVFSNVNPVATQTTAIKPKIEIGTISGTVTSH